MNIIHKIDSEFIGICKKILEENLSAEEWEKISSCDMFQTEHYCGGFEGTEMEFTFSYFDENRTEFWFQLPLEDVVQVEQGDMTSVELREADH